MRLSISIDEAKEIICQHISKHFNVPKGANPLEAVNFREIFEEGSFYLFEVDVDMVGI